MRKRNVAALATLIAASVPALAVDGFVESEADFKTINTGQTIQVQSFEGTPVQNGKSWTWGDVTFSCSGSWCNSGFGGPTTQFGVTDGAAAVYFGTPDVATFTFAKPIVSFGIDVWGLASIWDTPTGSPMASALTITYANGSHAFFDGYAWNGDLGAPALFAGAWFNSPITSISITGRVEDDGVYFDRLQYVTAPVPEPGTWVLMAMGLGLTALRRRKSD